MILERHTDTSCLPSLPPCHGFPNFSNRETGVSSSESAPAIHTSFEGDCSPNSCWKYSTQPTLYPYPFDVRLGSELLRDELSGLSLLPTKCRAAVLFFFIQYWRCPSTTANASTLVHECRTTKRQWQCRQYSWKPTRNKVSPQQYHDSRGINFHKYEYTQSHFPGHRCALLDVDPTRRGEAGRRQS